MKAKIIKTGNVFNGKLANIFVKCGIALPVIEKQFSKEEPVEKVVNKVAEPEKVEMVKTIKPKTAKAMVTKSKGRPKKSVKK